MVCPEYRKAPLCPICGNPTGIVSSHQRWCEHCDITTELSEQDKEYLQMTGAKLPQDFTMREKKQLQKFGHY